MLQKKKTVGFKQTKDKGVFWVQVLAFIFEKQFVQVAATALIPYL